MRDSRPTPWDLLVLGLALLFLAGYFPLSLLLTRTTITGGDTASHYYPALYLKDVLLPSGKIMGWEPGNFAGYPLFYFYFPLPFLLIALLGSLIPFQVAFKLVSVAGVFLLPAAAFTAFLAARVPSPGPGLAALATLPLLFAEKNAIWGGSITSTLTGEFAYAHALVLTLLFVVLLPRGAARGRLILTNGLLLGLIGLTHGYAFLFAVSYAAALLLTSPRRLSFAWYLTRTGSVAFAITAFWLLPTLLNSREVTSSSAIWHRTFATVFPPTFWPFLIPLLIGLLLFRRLATRLTADHRLLLRAFVHAAAVAITYFLIAYLLGILDIRFLPFLQLTALLAGAFFLAILLAPLRGRAPLLLGMTLALLPWLGSRAGTIEQWVRWNYSGFEARHRWPVLRAIADDLKGTFTDPRVTHEDAEANNALGSLRVFESLPLFAGRATLEGLHMLSSLSSPFVFFLQGEVTRSIEYSIPEYGSFTYDLRRAAAHMRLFNVRDFIVRTEGLHRELQGHPDYDYRKQIGPYHLYTVRGGGTGYVVPLSHEPVLCHAPQWKKTAYRWFRLARDLEVPLIFPRNNEPLDRFTSVVSDDYRTLPRKRIPGECRVTEAIRNETVEFTTSCPGRPHLIKVSYHPNWTVEGADAVYLASPAFMVVYPSRPSVTLRFTPRWPTYLGLAVTATGLLIWLVWRRRLAWSLEPISGLAALADFILEVRLERLPWRYLRIVGILLLLSAWSVAWVVVPRREMIREYQEGMRLYGLGRYGAARAHFLAIVSEHPETGEASNSLFQAAMCDRQEGKIPEMRGTFHRFLETYPDSLLVPEALYYEGDAQLAIGRTNAAAATWRRLINSYPDSPWSHTAIQRLPPPR